MCICLSHSDLWYFVGSSSFPYQTPAFLNSNICCHLLLLFFPICSILIFFNYFFEVLVKLLIFSHSGHFFALSSFLRARWGWWRRLGVSYWCVSLVPSTLLLHSQSVVLTTAFTGRKPASFFGSGTANLYRSVMRSALSVRTRCNIDSLHITSRTFGVEKLPFLETPMKFCSRNREISSNYPIYIYT